MIIDFHTHIGREDVGYFSNPEMLLKEMKRANVEVSVIFPLHDENCGACFKNSNDNISRISKKYPNDFVGFMRLDPTCPEKTIKNEVKRCVDLGLKGIKVHPYFPRFKFTKKIMEPIMIMAETYNMPIITHTGYSNDPLCKSQYIIDIAKKFKNVKIIAAHGRGYQEVVNALKNLSNFYIDTSCIVNHGHLSWFASNADNKVLFGSDFPFSLPIIERMKIDMIKPNMGIPQKDGMKESIKRDVLGNNAKRILGL
jgi:hypothetical protein